MFATDLGDLRHRFLGVILPDCLTTETQGQSKNLGRKSLGDRADRHGAVRGTTGDGSTKRLQPTSDGGFVQRAATT